MMAFINLMTTVYTHKGHLPSGMVDISVKNNEHLDQVRKTLMELCKYYLTK